MSNIDKQALRERYSPKPVPECHICGEEMTIQRISASRITYGCTGEGDDGYFKFGRTFADEHYEKSRVTVVDVSDPDVLALLDENLQLQREKDAIEAMALALRDDMRQAREIKPVKGEVLVTVSGFTGCGKSAIAGEIEIAMKAIGVPVTWSNGDAEKRMTGADWLTAIEMYKPSVRIVEVNVPRAAGIKVNGE
ncbi:TPA: ead/Ea22-like family protein [Salmonella enterica]|nr:ead/Ea22-like family protein [Salmonella enterica]